MSFPQQPLDSSPTGLSTRQEPPVPPTVLPLTPQQPLSVSPTTQELPHSPTVPFIPQNPPYPPTVPLIPQNQPYPPTVPLITPKPDLSRISDVKGKKLIFLIFLPCDQFKIVTRC